MGSTIVTNPLTKSWGMRYDTYGYVLTSTNPLQQSTSYTHNSLGWLTQVTAPMTYSATVSYDPYGDPLIITDTRHFTTTYSYDNVGNLIHVTDANFRSITNTYNLDNELTRAARPDGTHSDYEYDNAGRVLTQTNGLGQSTKYHYDDINRIVTVTDPLTRTQSYAYDLVGNTTIITDARGLTTTYGYDNAYQLLNINYHDSGTGTTTPNVSYTYNSRGLRDSMTDGTGTSYYIYDSLNRLTSYENGAGATVGYGYDNASRILSITYPGTSHTVTRGYDDANRLTSVTDWLSPSHTTSFGYNADGALISQTYPNSTQMLIGRDEAQEVVTMTHTYTPTSTTLRSFSYTHDPVGVITSTVDSPTGSHTYSYDPLYRLVGDQIPGLAGSNRTYQYDAATEIYSTTYTQGGLSGSTITTTRGYDAADELKTLLERTNGTTTSKDLTFTYDDNGNRTYQYDAVSNKHNAYTFDSENRLVNAVYGVFGRTATDPWTYTYNGDGLRMGKSQLQTSYRYFAWDINEGLPLLLEDKNGSVGSTYFIYGPGGQVVEQISESGTPYYYHPDQLGSIRAITNSSGSVVNSYNYDAYGNRLSSTTETVYNPFGYTGQYTDAESGFVYLRARYYDPSTQQFLTVDPIVARTEQAYAYAGGSPNTLVDPSGFGYQYEYDYGEARPSTGWGGAAGPFGGGGSGGGSAGADSGCTLILNGRCYSDDEAQQLIDLCGSEIYCPAGWRDQRCNELYGLVQAQESLWALGPVTWPTDPNRLNHVFNNPGHKWNLTGLSQKDNMALIQRIANTPSKLVSTSPGAGGGFVHTFVDVYQGLTIEVRVFESPTGVATISDAWVR